MSSKKKLVISLSVAAAVLVAAIIAIVAVFAAAQQTVKSSVSVTFRAKNVDCTVEATYETNTDEADEAFERITINAADAKQEYIGNVPDVVLEQGESGDVYLLLKYTFTNNSARDMVVKLDFTTGNPNFEITTGADDLATGVTIPGKLPQGQASNDIFEVKMTLTKTALDSAADIEMDVTLTWDLQAVYSE